MSGTALLELGLPNPILTTHSDLFPYALKREHCVWVDNFTVVKPGDSVQVAEGWDGWDSESSLFRAKQELILGLAAATSNPSDVKYPYSCLRARTTVVVEGVLERVLEQR